MRSPIHFFSLIALLVLTLPHVGCAAQGGLPGQVAALELAVANLQAQLTTIATLQTTVNNNLQSQLNTANAEILALQTQVGALSGLATNSVLALDGKLTLGNHNGHPAAVFTGVNVQVVNGTGQTENTANGLGNLIVGYDSLRFDSDYPSCSIGPHTEENPCEEAGGTWAVNHRSGSHYIIVGDLHNYSAYAGVLFGTFHQSNKANASVVGGRWGTASGAAATVSGGYHNTASGGFASVSGGEDNTASGPSATVSGGKWHTASGQLATVSGGQGNTAIGVNASVSGGENNTASGDHSSVLGGLNQNAGAPHQTIPILP